MVHLWLRAEPRANERRAGLTPEGAADLLARGFAVTVEDSAERVFPTAAYRAAGCTIAPGRSWPQAPRDAIVFGLKELPDDGTPLPHRHIMFGHAFKGQPEGRRLLRRFAEGGGTLYDLEYLVDQDSRRVAAFGYWAGYAGAAVALKCWAAQQAGGLAGPVEVYDDADAMQHDVSQALAGQPRPEVLIIGAKGRVGTGAADLCRSQSLDLTLWDMAETAHGGPFPQVLAHGVFLNAILARPGCPVFVPADVLTAPRALRVIGDIACDPGSAYNPVRVYDRTTSWDAPALRVHDDPPLDVTAIDNLPSLLPRESSQDFAAQLLPSLRALDRIGEGVWAGARAEFERHRPNGRSS